MLASVSSAIILDSTFEKVVVHCTGEKIFDNCQYIQTLFELNS